MVQRVSSGRGLSRAYPSPQDASNFRVHFGEASGFSDAGENVDYFALLRRLWRRKWYVAGTVIVITGLASGYVATLPNHYVAHSLLLVGSRNSDTLPMPIGKNTASPDNMPDREALQTEVEILHSPALAAEVIRDLGLENSPEFDPSLANPPWPAKISARIQRWFLGLIHLSAAQKAKPRLLDKQNTASEVNQTIQSFLGNLHVSVKGTSRIIDVSFDAESPQQAKNVTNSIVSHYIADEVHARSQSAAEMADWLRKKIVRLQSQFDNSEKVVEQFRSQAGLYSVAGGEPLLLKEMADVTTQLATAREAHEALSARLTQLRKSISAIGKGPDATTDMLNSPVMGALRLQASKVQQEITDESSILGPSHPKIRALKAQLQGIHTQMRREASRIESGLTNELEIASLKDEDLKGRLDRLKQEVDQMNKSSITLRRLEREADADRLVLDNFIDRLKATSSESDFASQRPQVDVVSAALAPTSPNRPKRRLLIAIAAVCSLVMGGVIALLRDKSDDRLRSEEDVRTGTRCESLGLIPFSRQAKNVPVDISRFGASPYRNSIKTIYTNLFVLAGQPIKTVLITSCGPREGKTTLALSLAAIAGQDGRRPVVIDADFWQSGACSALNICPTGPGLAELLDNAASLGETLITDTNEGFDILPPGRFSRARAVSRVENLADLLATLRLRYDVIIIDSPPVLAVPESLVIAKYTDAAVVAVRWGVTRRDTVNFVLDRLGESGAAVSGIVLSMVDERYYARGRGADSAYRVKDFAPYYQAIPEISYRGGTTRQSPSPKTGGPFLSFLAAPCLKLIAGGRWYSRRMAAPLTHTYSRTKKALLIIDIQDEFTTAAGWYTAPNMAVDAVIEAVNRASAIARANRQLVVHTHQSFGTCFARIMSAFLFGRKKRRGESNKLTHHRINPAPSTCFLRSAGDAFSNPKLDEFLRRRRVDHLFLMGMDGVTSVGQTALTALERGYRVTLITDGIFTPFERKWARTLTELEKRGVFGLTVSEFDQLFCERSTANAALAKCPDLASATGS